MVVFLAVRHQDAAPQQVGDGVGVAPQQFIAVGHQNFARGFMSMHNVRAKAGERNLKKSPDVLRHDLQRSQRGAGLDKGGQCFAPEFF